MKLLCWNIGIKIDNTKKVLEFIKDNHFDILAFQEALKAHDEKTYPMFRTQNDTENTFKKEFPFTAFAPVWGAKAIIKNGLPARDFGGFVEQGCYTLSKYEILEHYNQFYYLDYKEPGFDATNFKRDDHARSIQNMTLDINGQKLQVINVHGTWNEDKLGNERTANQCNFIIEKALENDYPTIIVGDFNLLPNSKDIKLMNNHFRNLVVENNIRSTRPTFDDGLDKGDIVCDYIFVNDKIVVNDFQVIENDISDHMPLVLDFDIKIKR